MGVYSEEQIRDAVMREKATYEFGKLDHLVRRDWDMFPETQKRWMSEGWDGSYEQFKYNADPYYYVDLKWGGLKVGLVDLVGIDLPVVPCFEEKIVNTDEKYNYQQTLSGAIEMFPKGKDRGGEVMPEYWKNPVETSDDWYYKIKPRLDPDTPERWVNFFHADEAAAIIGRGDRLYGAGAIGCYMFLRAMLGPEPVLYAFYDYPDMIHDMLKTWLHLVKTALLRVQKKVPFFKLLFGEDISYKNGLLISPKTIEEFLSPYYTDLLTALSESQDVPIHFEVDSDGNMKEFIPIYKKLGFTAFDPFEIAAGNDIVEIGTQYPDIVILGGIDKRILGKSKNDIKEYLDRVMPFFVKRGGYIPTCDHNIPSTVPYENYRYYRELITSMDNCN
jgi:uroporphyrinogen decarboxylase